MFSLQLLASHCAFLETLGLRDGIVYSLEKQFGGQSNKFGENYVESKGDCPSGRVQAAFPCEQIPSTEHLLEVTFCRYQLGQC